MRTVFFDGLKNRFNTQLAADNDVRYWFYVTAMFVDPKFKRLYFIQNNEDCNRIKACILLLVKLCVYGYYFDDLNISFV